MNENGNKYALAALKDKRAEIAGEINRFQEMARKRQEQLANIDATIRILDPSYPVETIAPKRIRRVRLFRQGELNRLILSALRKAGEPIHVTAIVTDIIASQGHTEAARPALTARVRGNLGYLWKTRKLIRKAGTGTTARWSLPG